MMVAHWGTPQVPVMADPRAMSAAELWVGNLGYRREPPQAQL